MVTLMQMSTLAVLLTYHELSNGDVTSHSVTSRNIRGRQVLHEPWL